ncbi:formimidoylglutamase [Kordia sp. YSTF-M3]|uniref:Formimidoylglutamase n=1 Tax=Kordia aestuariivivens TaxID=2759037 RepID=A0ABR7QE38_9FLAO|nr:formimidoylglutamase [Kordia aestuariivivens]MBC8756783.1 formimidoylglutamase [Kordia aestuariivivens]
MEFEFLSPVNDLLIAHNELLSKQALGNQITVHTSKHGIPETVADAKFAIIAVLENRSDINYLGEELNLLEIRKALFSLFPGNWSHKIVDLGNLHKGETVDDTYAALKTIMEPLLKKNIIPIIIGGSQDLMYAMYRAYDNLEQMVNIVNVDNKFDFGAVSQTVSNHSYMGKIIVEAPHNLFNYSNIGYQTYFNAQEEIDLMQKLFFDTYRLGKVSNDISIVEPITRDADIVGIDLSAVKASEVSGNQNTSPNGLDGKEICAISRYAGISDKVSSFGIFEYKNSRDEEITAMLVAQMIWYFIEGVNYRVNDYPFASKDDYLKYIVPNDVEEMIFYKSNRTERWWIEIPFISSLNNKLKRHTLLPCTHQDYLNACNQIIPERWWMAYKKSIN